MRIGKILLLLIVLVVLVNVGLYLMVSNRRYGADFQNTVEDDSETKQLKAQLIELEQTLEYQLELQREIIRVLREESNRWKKPSNSVEEVNASAVKTSVADKAATSKLLPSTAGKSEEKLDSPKSDKQQASELDSDDAIPVLLLACNRADFVTRTLTELVKVRGDDARLHPIVVSQDCRDAPTERAIRRQSESIAAYIQQPDQSGFNLPPNQHMFEGYYRIARHYRFAITSTFERFSKSKGIIIVEDDLSVAPDFFEYFRAGARLMQSDKSLWCVSAWNDNGKTDVIIQNASLLHRTDFFPGLGWLLSRAVWDDLAPRWPRAFWDDWMRQPDQRKGRACIRPELGRSSTFGRVGVSNGQFFDKFLQHVKHSDQLVRFTQLDLNYLLKDNYDESFRRDVYSNSVSMTLDEVKKALNDIPSDWATLKPIRIEYTSQPEFDAVAVHFNLMRDYKDGVPRTAYMGVVPFASQNRRIFLAPPASWKGYDNTWKVPA